MRLNLGSYIPGPPTDFEGVLALADLGKLVFFDLSSNVESQSYYPGPTVNSIDLTGCFYPNVNAAEAVFITNITYTT